MVLTEQELLNRLDVAKTVLLIEPDYPTKYPPFALAKIKTYLKKRNIKVEFSNKILPKKFDLICVTTLFTYYASHVFSVIKNKGFFNADTPIIAGGIFASLMPKEFDKFEHVDVFHGYSKVLDMQIPDKEIMSKVDEKWGDFSWVFTTRGCPNRCLSGDTVVNTVQGDIPIKDLVGKEIGVYTYADNEVFISKAINIREMGVKPIVRISFDDGTFIDCTKDHRFLTFKNGNQYVQSSETTKEAIDLLPGDRLRAFKKYQLKSGYVDVSWGRRKHQHEHRMVAEYKLGRKLKDEELVHHKKNKWDNFPDDIEVLSDKKEHAQKHPEIAQRMKDDNPSKYWTEDSKKKMSKAITGKKRTTETRQKQRKNMLGENNPNYKHGETVGQKSRIDGENHKVISVIQLDREEMTYDMEVPETSWFFANNVLVHNCAYCTVWRIEKDNWVNPEWKTVIPKGKKILSLLDNNISSAKISHVESIVDFVNERKLRILIESGVDCKYVTKDLAVQLAKMKYSRHGMRTAFDRIEEDGVFQKAALTLQANGINPEDMMAYVLFNFTDRPQDAEYRTEECQKLKIRAYPQCYMPLHALEKKSNFVGKHWTFRLTKGFRNFWIMKGIKHGFQDITFGQYINTKKGKKVYSLTDIDLDVWNNNGR